MKNKKKETMVAILIGVVMVIMTFIGVKVGRVIEKGGTENSEVTSGSGDTETESSNEVHTNGSVETLKEYLDKVYESYEVFPMKDTNIGMLIVSEKNLSDKNNEKFGVKIYDKNVDKDYVQYAVYDDAILICVKCSTVVCTKDGKYAEYWVDVDNSENLLEVFENLVKVNFLDVIESYNTKNSYEISGSVLYSDDTYNGQKILYAQVCTINPEVPYDKQVLGLNTYYVEASGYGWKREADGFVCCGYELGEMGTVNVNGSDIFVREMKLIDEYMYCTISMGSYEEMLNMIEIGQYLNYVHN